jgi:excisionase family DNA binding protein
LFLVTDEMTTGEAAQYLGCSRRYVTRLAATGALTPLRRIGPRGMYVLARADVEQHAKTVAASR